MRVSVVQTNSGHVKTDNIAQARALIEGAMADRPDLIGLPEVWTCLGGDRAAKFDQAETLPAAGSNEPGGEAYEFLRGVARSQHIHVHGGSIVERAGERLFNTTVVFDPEGHELARYRKIHLFDIVTPDGLGYRESATFGAGSEIVTYQAGGLTVGCAICYDVRFPELFLALRRAGAELIFLPAAFTLQTGKDHWEALIRARAIETQCWVIAAATTGRHSDARGEPRATWGHSMIVDPWGMVRASLGDAPGFATGDIDLAQVARVRDAMPVLQHRRLA